MDYEDKRNDIESELKELETQLESATGEDKIFFLQQSILELLKTRNYIYLEKQNARQGNC